MVGMNLQIRDESPGDFSSIDEVNRSAFEHDPHSLHNEQAIARALRAAGLLTISLVAELDGQVVGHVAISPVSISDGTPGWYGLGPVAVAPACQGRGIGQKLVQAALGRLRSLGGAGCVVLGNPKYYSRFGFRPNPALVLHGVRPQYFQALSFIRTEPKGEVTYHESFNALG